ncbi:head-tail connector protein [Qipengyuania sp. ASV99]|uniref:head-tail connector protein n=1 Tax=Qipengyuania sp. ASV99 TaxID=3399681 RepID=UPI003A4C5D1D
MRRRIVEPADVSASALAELKSWLGISRPNEDALLTGLLHASLDVCEGFTGQAPLSQLVEERIAPRAGRYSLSSRPVRLLVSAHLAAQDGTLTALEESAYKIELQAAGTGCVHLLADSEGQAVVLRLRVGIAETWETTPAAIKQGLIRLAAFQYRDRDRTGGSGNDAAPPASVTALWRPWRTLRLR